MYDQEPIAKTFFDAADLPPHHRFEAYRAAIGSALDIVQPTEAWHRDPWAWRMVWTAKDMTVRRVQNGGIRFARRPRASCPSRDEVLIVQCLAGGAKGLHGKVGYVDRPGVIAIRDHGSPVCGLFGNGSEFITVALPRSAVVPPGHDFQRLTLSVDKPLGRLVSTMVRALVEELPAASVAEGAELSTAMSGFVRGILAGRRADEDARAAFERTRADAVRRYIEENLTDPDVTVDRLCRAVGASRATIYRIFAGEGGVRRYINKRRLRAASDELSRAVRRRGVVAAACSHWGFRDLAHFSKAFRLEFGMTPSEAVGAARSDGND